MKKFYTDPKAELVTLLTNDIMTNSVIDDIADEIFGNEANDIPLIG